MVQTDINNSSIIKRCSMCRNDKIEEYFIKNKNICVKCNNYMRRMKYKYDERHKEKCKIIASRSKMKKTQERRDAYINKIGKDNKECRYCNEIKHKSRFRHNRRKCVDCERDDPKEKYKRYIRTRIYNALKRNKALRTIEYLGLSNKEYFQYIMNYDPEFTEDNYGPVWHIDHVIPVSLFDLNDDEQQKIAFNWRNTMPLSKNENLKKRNIIDTAQIQNHLIKLQMYHEKHNILFPKKFRDLFAKHLDAGNSLESCDTTSSMET